jgi:hypothetical protein
MRKVILSAILLVVSIGVLPARAQPASALEPQMLEMRAKLR